MHRKRKHIVTGTMHELVLGWKKDSGGRRKIQSSCVKGMAFSCLIHGGESEEPLLPTCKMGIWKTFTKLGLMLYIHTHATFFHIYMYITCTCMYIIIRVRKNVHTMYTKEILCSDSQMLYKGVNIHNTCTYSTVTCTMYVMYIIHVYIEGMVRYNFKIEWEMQQLYWYSQGYTECKCTLKPK